jgi:hypothetical protein
MEIVVHNPLEKSIWHLVDRTVEYLLRTICCIHKMFSGLFVVLLRIYF